MCTNDKNLRFLEICHDLNKDPWCADEEVNSYNDLCGGTCEKIKFLIPIMEEMRENDITNEQKKSSFVFQSLKFPFIFEQLFNVCFVILIITGSREI